MHLKRAYHTKTVARELFLDRGGRQDRERQSRKREIKIFAGIRTFLSRKEAFSKKKKNNNNKIFPGFGRISVPKIGSGYKSQRGQKLPRGSQNISSCPPTFRAYALKYCR